MVVLGVSIEMKVSGATRHDRFTTNFIRRFYLGLTQISTERAKELRTGKCKG